MKDLKQLLFKFKNLKNYNSEDFFVSESNFFAFNLVLNWPNWGKNILNIYGEKYSGKSHLSVIFQNKFGANKIDAKNLNDNFLTQFKTHQNLIIENFDENIDEKNMYSLINVVDRDNKFSENCNLSLIELLKVKNVKKLNKKILNHNFLNSHMLNHHAERIYYLLTRHFSYTNSKEAFNILSNFDAAIKKFKLILPTDYKRALSDIDQIQKINTGNKG